MIYIVNTREIDLRTRYSICRGYYEEIQDIYISKLIGRMYSVEMLIDIERILKPRNIIPGISQGMYLIYLVLTILLLVLLKDQ